MGMINCKRCGKLFESSGQKYCRECVESDEDAYRKIYEYVTDRKNDRIAPIAEIAKELDISERVIKRLVKAGRFAIAGLDWTPINCERCGVPIAEGMYCKSCKDALAKGMSRMATQLGAATENESKDQAEDKTESSGKKGTGFVTNEKFR